MAPSPAAGRKVETPIDEDFMFITGPNPDRVPNESMDLNYAHAHAHAKVASYQFSDAYVWLLVFVT